MQNSVAKKIFAVGSAVAMTLSLVVPFVAQAAAHAPGTNVIASDGTVWMITSNNTRRAYTSGGAFLSYGFNSFATVAQANADDLALPLDAAGFIPPQDGSIICSDRSPDKGTCYLITNGKKAGFTSQANFTGLGFSFANAMSGDVSFLPSDANINDTTSPLRTGVITYFNYNGNKTYFLVGANSLLGIPDNATFNSWGYSFNKAVPANASTQSWPQAGVMVGRMPGQLSPSWTATPGNPPVVVSGPISASLSYDTPAAGTVVSGQAAADLAHFTFSGNGSLSQITLQRTGVSANSSLNNVYLFMGNKRITDSASVNTSGQVLFNNLNIAVTGSVTVSVKADIATGLTSGTVGITLTGYTATGNNASTANLVGNTMVIASGSGVLAGVDIKKSGILTPTSGTTVTANAGSTAQTFWQTNVQVNTHSVWLKGVQFQAIGSAPYDALSNIQLYVNGSPVGSPATVGTNGYVFFDLSGSPVTLQTGSTQIGVLANIQKGSNRNVQFTLQNAADFTAVDSQLNVGVAPTVDGSSFAPVAAGTVNINTGTLNAVIDPTFQALTNVTGGSTNAVIGRFKLHAYGEDVKVMTLVASTTVAGGTPSTNQLNNVALYFGTNPSSLGQVGSSQTASGSNLTYNLGSSLIAPAGVDSYLEIRADIQNNSNTNYTAGTVTAGLVFGSSTAQGMSSLNTTGVLPSGSLTTTGLTIQTGTLNVAKSSYANQTLNPNLANQKLGEFTIQNQSSSEGVRVTNLAVGLYVDPAATITASGTDLTNISNLKTDETSGSGSQPINPAASNNFSVNFTLAPGGSKTIGVWGDLSTLTTGKIVVTILPTAFGASSGVSLTPSSSTIGQVISLASGTFSTTPTLRTATSNVSQFIPAAGGSVDGSHNVFNFTASNGVATISELKFAVIGTGTVSSIKVGTVSAPVSNPGATTLSAATSSASTFILVTSATNISAGTVLTIASSTSSTEAVLVTAVNGTALTVTRGIAGTAAIAHSSGEPVTIQGTAYLTGLNISVPNGGSGVDVDAVPTYAAVGTNGVVSGSTSQIVLVYDKHTIGGSTTSELVTPAAANTMSMVGSRPNLAVTTTSSGGLIVGENQFFNVTVTPDPKGSIQINTLVFSISTTSAISTVSAPRLAIGSTTITGSTCSMTGTLTATCNLPSGYVISGPQTFALYATITSSGLGSSGTSNVTVSLAASSNFSWTDVAGNSSSAVTSANTTYLNNYPTQTWSTHN